MTRRLVVGYRLKRQVKQMTARALMYVWLLLPLMPALGGLATWLAGVR